VSYVLEYGYYTDRYGPVRRARTSDGDREILLAAISKDGVVGFKPPEAGGPHVDLMRGSGSVVCWSARAVPGTGK